MFWWVRVVSPMDEGSVRTRFVDDHIRRELGLPPDEAFARDTE